MKNKKNDMMVKYYAIAIIVLLFFIVGITSSMVSKGKEAEKTVKKTESELPEAEEKKSRGVREIRVLIMSEDFKNVAHPVVTLTGESPFLISEKKEDGDIGDEWKVTDVCELEIRPDDPRLASGCIRLKNTTETIGISSLSRGVGIPWYRGVIELRSTPEGIVVVNALDLEDYLCGVVPSEMPADFEKEALKAQAVCARSYAYMQTEDYAYPEYCAHVNDSTGFQVYGNSGEYESTTKAVEETKGEVLLLDGHVVPAYYYSTSCGRTAGIDAWGGEETEENRYLRSVDVKDSSGDYERELSWYRWSTEIGAETLSGIASLNTGVDLGMIDRIDVNQKGSGGNVLSMTIVGQKNSVTIDTENKIRRVFSGADCLLKMNDGTETQMKGMLPSSFFTIEKRENMFVINGGGYGHGIGMSQNGANEMAKTGRTYRDILSLFYVDTQVGTKE